MNLTNSDLERLAAVLGTDPRPSHDVCYEVAKRLVRALQVERAAHVKLQREVSNMYNAKAPDVLPRSLR